MKVTRSGLKAIQRNFPLLARLYEEYRSDRLLAEYRSRREHYHKFVTARGIRYAEEKTVMAVRKRLAKRGFAPQAKRRGELRTFAFIPMTSWHANLLPGLRSLGPLTLFDYVGEGYCHEALFTVNESSKTMRRELNESAFCAIRSAHNKAPLDWVFTYASGRALSATTIKGIQEELGIPVVGMCFDDKQSWTGPDMGDHRAGQIDIAAHLDLAWTSSTVACSWYLAEGGRPLYLPEGCNPQASISDRNQRDLGTTFVGAAYGFRPRFIRSLRRGGIRVKAYGAGWEGGVPDDAAVVGIMRRSQINLGMGGIGYCEHLTNVKGRDFDIPATGGGVYLTTYNPDLARHFHIGSEIVCYRTVDEAIELARYFEAHAEEACDIAEKGYQRALRDHKWSDRFNYLTEALGLLEGANVA